MSAAPTTARRRRLHRPVLWLLFGIWVCLFAIALRAALLALAVPPVQVDTSGAFPVVIGFHGWSSAEQSGIRVGEPTFAALGEGGSGFVSYEHVPIRGRASSVDVRALPAKDRSASRRA